MAEIATHDGRTLTIHETGDPGGAPVLVHHGTPSAGNHFAPHAEDAAARGIRLLGYDRPGYGGSTSHEGRSVADAADDARAIADALELDRLAVWGISGGGPHALACGALLPDRVAAVASLASVAPIDAEGLDWLAGMGEDNLQEFAATRRGREALEEYLHPAAGQLLAVDAVQLLELFRSLLAPVDKAALNGELAEYFVDSARYAIGGGIDGWRDDDLAFDKPWGFAVEDIRVPVLLWHGAHDLFVPISHGRWLAERIPGVEACLSDEDGHLTLVTRRVPDVHAWLLERL